MASEARGIQSIDVGGAILSALVSAQTAVTLRDLAVATDMAPAQVHAYLTSFRRIGLVDQDAQTGQYFMGSFALRMGLGRIHSDAILNSVSKALAPLSAETGLMSVMAVWGPQGPTVVQTQDGSTSLNLNIRMGTLFSVVGTATGWVFAAFKADDVLARRVKFELSESKGVYWSDPAEAKKTFDRELAATRDRGYAQIAGEAIPGINAISIPVFDDTKSLVSVVTLIGRDDQFELAPFNPTMNRIVTAVKALSP